MRLDQNDPCGLMKHLIFFPSDPCGLMKSLAKARDLVLPLDEKEVERLLAAADGEADRVLLQLPTGKYALWEKMARVQSPIINDRPTTQIGEHDVPGRYKFSKYTMLEDLE